MLDALRYARLERIFHEVAELDPEEREVTLRRACGDDAALLDEARRLLEAHDGAAGFLEGPGEGRRGGRRGETSGTDVPALEVEGFRVVGELGRGAMGVVYLAEQEVPRRRVALKVLRAEAATREQLRRFDREVRVLGRLHHPGIAQVLAAGVAPTSLGPRPWFAMPRVVGRPLAEAARGLEPRGLARLFAALADAVHFAHRHGVVHRDLKPANVLVDGRGRPVVLDFGVAALRGEAAVEESLRTEPGALVGTLAYMAPEQTRRTAARLDGRADVYALGAMLYELSTGRLPVPVGDADLAEAVRRVREDEPPAAGSTGARVPRDLETIVSRCLEKTPARRYASAAALAEDLRRFAAHRPILARRPTQMDRVAKLLARHRVGFGALAAVLFTLVGGLAATSHALARARSAEAAAARQAVAVQRHHDALLVGELEARLDDLWPAVPERLAELDAWVERGEALRARLPLHRAWLASSPSADGTEDALARRRLARADRLFAPPTAAPGFPELVRRRDLARALHARSVGAHRARWDAAIEAIAAHPAYGGLRLAPQLGLVPLGPDPASGLHELAHLASGAVPERDPATGRLRLDEASAIVLVLVPGGVVPVGHQAEDPGAPRWCPTARPHEGPVEVALDPFLIGKHEVTQAQYARAMGANPSYWAPGDENAGYAYHGMHPVEQVDWDDAARFAARLDLALPTEAQFEHAQRGGTETAWWTGDDPLSLAGRERLHAHRAAPLVDAPGPWERWSGTGAHAPIGSYAPNPFGLHDTAGNLVEWCRDVFWVDASLAPPRPGDGLRVRPEDPDGRENAHRSLRGGSLWGGAHTHASGFRDDAVRSSASRLHGFRVARALDPRERGAPPR